MGTRHPDVGHCLNNPVDPPRQIGALSWSLSKEEVAALDTATAKLPPLVPPETSPFPKQSLDSKLVMFDS